MLTTTWTEPSGWLGTTPATVSVARPAHAPLVDGPPVTLSSQVADDWEVASKVTASWSPPGTTQATRTIAALGKSIGEVISAVPGSPVTVEAPGGPNLVTARTVTVPDAPVKLFSWRLGSVVVRSA